MVDARSGWILCSSSCVVIPTCFWISAESRRRRFSSTFRAWKRSRQNHYSEPIGPAPAFPTSSRTWTTSVGFPFRKQPKLKCSNAPPNSSGAEGGRSALHRFQRHRPKDQHRRHDRRPQHRRMPLRPRPVIRPPSILAVCCFTAQLGLRRTRTLRKQLRIVIYRLRQLIVSVIQRELRRRRRIEIHSPLYLLQSRLLDLQRRVISIVNYDFDLLVSTRTDVDRLDFRIDLLSGSHHVNPAQLSIAEDIIFFVPNLYFAPIVDLLRIHRDRNPFHRYFFGNIES